MVISLQNYYLHQPQYRHRLGDRRALGNLSVYNWPEAGRTRRGDRRDPHYVVVDDKVRILAAIKKAWGERVTTVFPCQGKFAHDPKVLGAFPIPDVTVERIGDLPAYELCNLVGHL